MATFFRFSLDAANRRFHPSFLRSRHPCTQVYTVPNTLSLPIRRRLVEKERKSRMKRGGGGGGWLKGTTRKPTKTEKGAKKRRRGGWEESEQERGKVIEGKRERSRKLWLRQVRVWRGRWRQGGGSTGCFIMQKLSRQLGRSGSAPLHQHRVGGSGGGGGSGGSSGIQLGGGGLEKASAPESRKYRQPFCDKLFSAGPRRATPRRAPCRATATATATEPPPPRPTLPPHGKARLHRPTHGEKVWTRSRKGESRGGLATAAIFYAWWNPRMRVFVEHAGTDGGWAWKWREKERIRRGWTINLSRRIFQWCSIVRTAFRLSAEYRVFNKPLR